MSRVLPGTNQCVTCGDNIGFQLNCPRCLESALEKRRAQWTAPDETAALSAEVAELKSKLAEEDKAVDCGFRDALVSHGSPCNVCLRCVTGQRDGLKTLFHMAAEERAAALASLASLREAAGAACSKLSTFRDNIQCELVCPACGSFEVKGAVHCDDDCPFRALVALLSGAEAQPSPLAAENAALREALKTAEAALADIGDAEGPDLREGRHASRAWLEQRAAKALPLVRRALSGNVSAYQERVEAMRTAIEEANTALMDVSHHDIEHQIHSHADTLPETARWLAAGIDKALAPLQRVVHKWVDEAEARAAKAARDAWGKR